MNLSPPDSQSSWGFQTEHRRRSPHGSQRQSGHGGHLEGQSCRSLWKYPTSPIPKPQAFFQLFLSGMINRQAVQRTLHLGKLDKMC